MATMNVLRMLVDLSLFYSIAALIAASYGGSGLFLGALIQCICFGLSSVSRNRRALRLLCLLPISLCWYVYRASPANCILLIPTTLYIIWLVFKEEYTLSHARQARIFSLMLKVIPVFILFCFLTGQGTTAMQITLPFTAAFLIGSVFLMRALRHTPKVYCQRKYQLVNASAIALVAAGGCLLSSDLFLGTFLALLKGFYTRFILPVLYLLVTALALLLSEFVRLFSFIEWKNPEKKQDLNLEILDPSDLLVEMGAPSDFSVILKQALIAGGILLICLLVFLFFRWLNGRESPGSREEPIRMVSRIPLSQAQTSSSVQDNSVTRSIRTLYRKFLKYCVDQGIQIDRSSTSLDVDERAARIPGFSSASPQIRSIYILARYGGNGEKSDLKKMKELFSDAKSQNKG